MKTFPKGTTIDTINIQTGEIIHMDFAFYTMNSIQSFTSMLTVVCENTRMLCVFPTVSKRSPVQIICFILITLNNEKHPFRQLRVDKDDTLENSTYVTNLIVDDFSIEM